MHGDEYKKAAMRTNDGLGYTRVAVKINELAREEVDYDFTEATNAALGLCGEAGEVCDMIKKWIFHEAELDQEHLKKEIGDVMWYVALMCDAFNWSLDDILEINIDKLKKRYPDGFDSELSAHRKEGDV